MNLTQYNIIIVNLDPTIGSEIRKTRPCVIISPDEINKNLRTIVITPITSNLNNYPTRVSVFFDQKEGKMVIDQIRTIDKSMIIKCIGKLSSNEISMVKSVIEETFVK